MKAWKDALTLLLLARVSCLSPPSDTSLAISASTSAYSMLNFLEFIFFACARCNPFFANVDFWLIFNHTMYDFVCYKQQFVRSNKLNLTRAVICAAFECNRVFWYCSYFANFRCKFTFAKTLEYWYTTSIGFYCFAYKVKILMILTYPKLQCYRKIVSVFLPRSSLRGWGRYSGEKLILGRIIFL